MIMESLGCSQKFLSMVIQLYKDQRSQIRLNRDLSESFPIVNGVKQDCVLVPTLFSIFFSMMLKQVIEDLNDVGAVYIRYRLDGSLFNLRRQYAHTKTLEQLFHDLHFTDDAAVVAHTERTLQHLTSSFAEAAQLFGLVVTLKKTKVLHQPAPLEEYWPSHITIGGTELKAVYPFIYMRWTITADAKIYMEVDKHWPRHTAPANRATQRQMSCNLLKKRLTYKWYGYKSYEFRRFDIR